MLVYQQIRDQNLQSRLSINSKLYNIHKYKKRLCYTNRP